MTAHRFVALALTLFFAGPSARADWVTLTDGRRIRGIQFKKHGSGYLFTGEDGRTAFIPAAHLAGHTASDPNEQVNFRDSTTTLRKKILILKRERMARRRALERAVVRWARGGKEAAAAEARVLAEPAQDQELCFGSTLASSSSAPARTLAARRLGRFKTAHAARALAIAAVADRSSRVRAASLEALGAIKYPEAGAHFVPFLISARPAHRVRASQALRTFPTYRAVPALIITVTKIWTGGGRSYFFQGAQRAYIGDYELVSGGTAFTLAEVADPIVQFNETGVVLDAKIRQSEQRIHLTTLETITGRNFGLDARAWRRWWQAEGEALAQAALRKPQEKPAEPAGADAGKAKS
jgi:hypothetical protein